MVMPNLDPPIRTTDHALAYRQRILDALPAGVAFEPLMTLYLTDSTTPQEIQRAKDSGLVFGVGEAFLAGATTNSAYGVSDFVRCRDVLQAMEELSMPLLLHGEVTDPQVDVFDREAEFIQRHLISIVERFPRLKVVLEHITTRQAVEFVAAAPPNVAATITVHHLLLNRNAMFTGGLRPHAYCLPVLKREEHRLALVAAATQGNPKFFLGTDSAPHPRTAKEADCGCAGIYSANVALELYSEVFADQGALHRLEGFASIHGAAFYGLPRNPGTITLVRREWRVPETVNFGVGPGVSLRAGEVVGWQVENAVDQ